MRKARRLGAQETGCAAFTWLPSAILRRLPRQRNLAKEQGRRSLVARLLLVAAACLAAAFLAFIVLEAFDSDPDLWPFGAQNFTVAGNASSVTSGHPVGAVAALTVVCWFVVAAGAHLVMGHRARSALATDNLSIASGFSMAEPWWQNLNDAPVLGHFICTGAIVRKVASSTGGLR